MKTLLPKALSSHPQLALYDLIDVQNQEADIDEDTQENHNDKSLADLLSESKVIHVFREPIKKHDSDANCQFIDYVLVSSHF